MFFLPDFDQLIYLSNFPLLDLIYDWNSMIG